MRLYHKDVFFPEFDLTDFWNGVDSLVCTRHFRERQLDKNIPLLDIDIIRSGEIFEVGIEFDEVLKVCYRVHTPNVDYCYVIRKGGVVVTAWVQSPDDLHSTLDESKYWKE